MSVHVQRLVTIGIWAVIAVGGVLIAWQIVLPSAATAETVIVEPMAPGTTQQLDSITPAPTAAPPQAIAQIMYISGAVQTPGVYAFDGGRDVRIVDLVVRAGGLRADADAAAINLAAAIGDTAHVHVPVRGTPDVGDTASASAPTAVASQTINVNRASVDELSQLPGVGPALAQRIIDFREQHGPFTSLDDLDAVSGVGPSLLAKLEAHVVFN